MLAKTKTAMLILAAGNSSRMGQPKQLLPWNNTTLLGHTIEQGKLAGIEDIYVVLGAYKKEIQETLIQKNIRIVTNEQWEMGMGVSIAIGVQKIQKSKKSYSRLLITLCDQPLLLAKFYRQLIHSLSTSDKIAMATCYNQSLGVPAVFDISVFEALTKLNSKIGAKALLNSLKGNAACIKANAPTADIDTMTAYQSLYQSIFK
ncbi:NTP transferase domain-containing protein [Ascidiimonas sp. W6]|uniref:nucleotidyltransferase family protein n=1 Tax=Ascidiimonas meishanensis TaxID=3128903 RepID=UPI0030EDC761